ncbi:Uncharacterized protein PECH_001062 [Penicillium ucsense]|uniref:Uncharacterized protein n=1 Tax=Penicillium ucsense TaxID=2839758 RepID=A0A8J8WJ59_9EURO|nr:Uncharacterized protein PECM_002379 [Penicillium ucsense]KAF7738301.1 Uncharacterized protein PECH_001062 [Penicillium ucsense]
MRVFRSRAGHSQSSLILLLLVVLVTVVSVSAQGKDTTTDAAQTTTADPSSSSSFSSTTNTDSVSSGTTASASSSTKSSSSSSNSLSTMDSTTTTTSSSSSSTTTDTTSTSSVSTTTDSTSSSSSTSTSSPLVTVPPTDNAPYMQMSNIPEGTVFIAVGAILGLIGLAVLAWRALVAWSVNRSVRRAALAQSSEKRRLSRRSAGGRKRSHGHGVYTAAAPGNDVSLDKLGTTTRTTYKSSKRVPSSSSGLFFSPTAGGTGSHASFPNSGNRGSTYLPAGYYAAAGVSTPSRDPNGSQPHIYSPTGTGGPVSPGGGYFAGSSPSLPAVGGYSDVPPNRHSYMAASSSSLNLNQPPQGRAPSAYLEDLFESHTSPRASQSGLDRH